VAVNASEVAIAPKVNLEDIDGAPSEIVAGYLKSFSKRLHEL
jgi:hypothetical protein